MEFTAAADEAVPVLIVGGGGAGPTAADDPLDELAGALCQILARPVASPRLPAGSGVPS